MPICFVHVAYKSLCLCVFELMRGRGKELCIRERNGVQTFDFYGRDVVAGFDNTAMEHGDVGHIAIGKD